MVWSDVSGLLDLSDEGLNSIFFLIFMYCYNIIIDIEKIIMNSRVIEWVIEKDNK